MFKEGFIIPNSFFMNHAEHINSENKVQMTKLALNGSFVTAVLFLLSVVYEPIRVNQGAYLFIFLYSLAVYCLTLFIQDKNKFILPLFYLYMTGCFGFAIYLAMFAGDLRSRVSFCVFMVLLPTFVIDRQWRMYGYLIMMAAVYLYCSFFVYNQTFSASGAVDCLAFLGISLVNYAYNMRLHVKDIESRQILTKKVETDSLTQLFNRSALEKNIMAYMQENEEAAAFILVDVDNFKGINDSFGHVTGDELLYQTASILREQFRRSDLIGRLGGDEFVIFLPRVSEGEWLLQKMQQLVDEMDRTFIGDKAICNVSGSVGIALYPQNGRSFDELYQKADVAMYQSKKSGKNRFTVYES